MLAVGISDPRVRSYMSLITRTKPSTSSRSESLKRNMLLQALHRRGVASRLALARALHISNSRVCDLVEQMISEGLLAEEGVGKDRRGRRGVSVRINPAYGQLIGFDMEAKRLRMVATDFSGQVIWQSRQPLSPPKDRQALVDQILQLIDTAMREVLRQRPRPIGFGIGGSGVLDTTGGVVLHYDMLPLAVELPLRE